MPALLTSTSIRPKFGNDFLYRSLDLVFLGDVEREYRRLTTSRGNLRGDFVQFLAITRCQCNRRSGFRQNHRTRPANSLRSPGDQRYPSLHTCHAYLLGCDRNRTL